MRVDIGTAPPPRDPRGRREGFTTGACATAASLAATRALLRQEPASVVIIQLPGGRRVTFALLQCQFAPEAARCTVIKDGGDDPDVTHGAEIVSTVAWRAEPGLELVGGIGVGLVTRPGLGLEVGGPAINPVPRRMITEHVTAEAGHLLAERGLRVEVSVPRGIELAKKTLNARLGIVGGISILGTTGIVKPWSTAAWRASVLRAIDVAAAGGERHVVLATGGWTERYSMRLLPHLPEPAFVEMGGFTEIALKRCAARGIRRVTLAGMIGKLSKLAIGRFLTHGSSNRVDITFLAGLAAECGVPPDVQALLEAAATARHFQELVLAHGLQGVFDRLAGIVCQRGVELVRGDLEVDCLLFDARGSLLGRGRVGSAQSEASSTAPPG